MAQETDALPPRTHNQPAPMTPEQVTAYLDEICADLTVRQREIAAGIARFLTTYPEIPNDDIYGRAGDFAGGRGAIGAFIKTAKARHDAEKAPFLGAGRAVDQWFRALTATVEKERELIVARMTKYATKREAEARARAEAEAREAQRRADEAAAQARTAEEMDAAIEQAKLAEEAERIAAAPATELTRMTGAAGVTVSMRTTWRFIEEESDLMALVRAVAAGKAPLAYLAFNGARIGLAVRSEKVRQIPGCVIREERQVV